MKFLLIVSAFVAAALGAPTGEEFHSSGAKCKQLYPLPEDYLEKIKNHEKVENLGKLSLCIAKAEGTITDEGKINKEKLKELFERVPGVNDDKVNAALEECAKDYENEIETALKLADCAHKHFVH